ncbi:MAG: DUF1573 domain-containing protein [Phycisphaerales bacterium]|nr:DUF1573 domain-containing protein [Phycisphaerales bacterium]
MPAVLPTLRCSSRVLALLAASCLMATGLGATPVLAQDRTPPTRPPTTRPVTPREAPPARTAPGRDIGRGDSSRDPLPPVQAEPSSIDVGVYPPKGHGMGTVTLTNVGKEPLKIVAVQTGCACTTTSDMVGTVIEPGASVPLEVRIDGGSVPTVKRTSVKVLFEGYTRVFEISAKGETAYAVRIVPAYINATGGKGRTGRIVMESVDGKPFKVCSVNGKAPNLAGFDAAKDEPRSQYVLDYDLAEFETDKKVLPLYLLVETDRADCPLLDLPIRQDSLRRAAGIRGARDVRLGAGQIESGGSAMVDLEFRNADGLTVSKVESSSDLFATEIVSTETEEPSLLRVHVRITPKEGFTGVVNAPIRSVSNRGTQETYVFFRVVSKDAPGCSSPEAWKSVELPLGDEPDATQGRERTRERTPATGSSRTRPTTR